MWMCYTPDGSHIGSEGPKRCKHLIDNTGTDWKVDAGGTSNVRSLFSATAALAFADLWTDFSRFICLTSSWFTCSYTIHCISCLDANNGKVRHFETIMTSSTVKVLQGVAYEAGVSISAKLSSAVVGAWMYHDVTGTGTCHVAFSVLCSVPLPLALFVPSSSSSIPPTVMKMLPVYYSGLPLASMSHIPGFGDANAACQVECTRKCRFGELEPALVILSLISTSDSS